MNTSQSFRIAGVISPDEEQLRSIRTITQKCNTIDGTHYTWFDGSHFLNEGDVGTFLALREEKIIGWIQVFSHGGGEGELIAQVAPEHRQKGIFNALLEEARKELRRRKIPVLLLTCDTAAEEAVHMAEHLGAEYHISEFLMRYEDRSNPEDRSGYQQNVRLVPAGTEDREVLAAIGNEGFPDNIGDFGVILDPCFHSVQRNAYRIESDDRIVGVIAVYYSDPEVYIHAFAIAANHRGRGIGRAALAETVRIIKNRKPENPIELEVETENARALDLYRNVGFQVITEFRYYRLEVG